MRSLLALALVGLVACERGDDAGLAAENGEDALSAPPSASPRPPRATCTPPKRFTGAAWPEADALFHSDPRWLGGDAAYTVELAPGRILWLFGDSFIAKTDAHVRSQSTFVRNSIAIQSGTDPTTAKIEFFWHAAVDAGPAPSPATSFFPEDGTHWFWPVHGTRIPGGELVLFLGELERADGGLGFATVGTRLARIANPDDEPMKWRVSLRKLPSDGRSHGIGVVAVDGYLHSLTTKKGAFFHDVELERWKLDALDTESAFWNGEAFGPEKTSVPVWGGGAPEFITAPYCNEWLTVESVGFGATDITVRRAKALAGPWTDAVPVFRPEESRRANPFVYAGKLHPELTGADLVATYAANSFDFAEVIRDATLYYPRFVKLDAQR